MSNMPKWLLVAALVVLPSLGTIARADVNNASATNVQQGDNSSDTTQHGTSKSGDGVGGQVVGVVSGGKTSVNATNKTDDSKISTGKSSGTNHAASFTGLTAGSSTALVGDVANLAAPNVQEGDNEVTLTQSATATSGDGVGGSVIGVVTTAGGSADIVAANTTTDTKIDTGKASATNDAATFVGLNATGTVTALSDVANASATNVQEGDNSASVGQTATSKSGDGVGGQVLGVVSTGAAKIDATSKSEDVKISTGDSNSRNSAALFVGLTAGSSTPLTSDVANSAAVNVQQGDNSKDLAQSADSTSGDGVAGQVAGVVTSAGGSADLVLANTSTDSTVESGKSDFTNTDASFVGLNPSGVITVF